MNATYFTSFLELVLPPGTVSAVCVSSLALVGKLGSDWGNCQVVRKICDNISRSEPCKTRKVQLLVEVGLLKLELLVAQRGKKCLHGKEKKPKGKRGRWKWTIQEELWSRQHQRATFVPFPDSGSSWPDLITDSCLASKESPSVIWEGVKMRNTRLSTLMLSLDL